MIFFLTYPLSYALWLYLFVYGLPTNLQFATFSLLVMYFARRVHAARWAGSLHWIAYTACLFANIVLASIHLIVAVVAMTEGDVSQEYRGDDDGTGWWVNSGTAILFSAVFFVLVAMLAAYGFAIWRERRSDPSFPKKPTQRAMLVAAGVVCFCYTFRGVWDLLLAADVVTLNLMPDRVGEMVLVVVMFVIWEIAPMSIVVALFGAVPATAPYKQVRTSTATPGQFSLNSEAPQLPDSRSFLLPPPQPAPVSPRGLAFPAPLPDERTPILRTTSGHAPAPPFPGQFGGPAGQRSPDFSPALAEPPGGGTAGTGGAADPMDTSS